MNSLEYCQDVVKGLSRSDSSDSVYVREFELILLANGTLFHLIEFGLLPDAVAEFIRETIEEFFEEEGLEFYHYPRYIRAMLANSELHHLVAKGVVIKLKGTIKGTTEDK